jgi:putative addiction module component (TIGR02574 family)
MNDLRSQIKSLSPAEKAELLDTIWESLEADSASLTDAQRAELDHRITRHEQSPSDVIAWQQVRTGLLKEVINSKVRRGIDQLNPGEGIPEDQLDAYPSLRVISSVFHSSTM